MDFRHATDEDLRQAFAGIITKGPFNNTYKFALARFLLDHCNESDKERVRYSRIALFFFRYYWLQECKSRLRQGPANQTPEVINIIRSQFTEKSYPHTYEELVRDEPEKIEICVREITKKCFDDVIPRFQKVKCAGEKRLFFTYFAHEYKDSADNKKVDPGGGILLNKRAMGFLRDNYVPLHKAVILEWIRFLEQRNFGTPNLVNKIEGRNPGKRDQRKFLRLLVPFVEECFYCSGPLRPGKETHVDHVIPFDYIGNTEMWNMVLACQQCNCTKSGSLPPKRYVEKLLVRNNSCRDRIPALHKSLATLNYGDHDVKWHYDNAKRHGYPLAKDFP